MREAPDKSRVGREDVRFNRYVFIRPPKELFVRDALLECGGNAARPPLGPKYSCDHQAANASLCGALQKSCYKGPVLFTSRHSDYRNDCGVACTHTHVRTLNCLSRAHSVGFIELRFESELSKMMFQLCQHFSSPKLYSYFLVMRRFTLSDHLAVRSRVSM